MNFILAFISFLGLFFIAYCKDHPLSPIIRKVRAEESLSDEEKTLLARSDERDLPQSLQRLVRTALTGYVLKNLHLKHYELNCFAQ